MNEFIVDEYQDQVQDQREERDEDREGLREYALFTSLNNIESTDEGYESFINSSQVGTFFGLDDAPQASRPATQSPIQSRQKLESNRRKNNPIGTAIRDRRLALGMPQGELAEKMGVTPGLVSHWEHGRARVLAETLEPLAAVLQTTRAYLVGDNPNMLAQTDDDEMTDRQRRLLLSIWHGMTEEDRGKLLVAALSIAGFPVPSEP